MAGQQEKIFADGMKLKDRHPNTPDWVKATILFNVESFKETLDKHGNNGWMTVNLKVSQGGKKYFEVDTWKPTQGQAPQPQPAPQPQAYQQPSPAPQPPQDQQILGWTVKRPSNLAPR